MRWPLNIPNTITLARILLTVPALIFLFQKDYAAALWLFLICSVTDGLDGFLARYLNQRTPLGTLLDPLADKLLVVSFLVGLTLMGNIPLWFTVVLLSRDGVIAVGTFFLFSKTTRREISPTFVGKTATVFAFGVVLLTLFELGTHSHFWKKMAHSIPSLLVATLGFSLYSAGQYVAHSLKEIRAVSYH